MPELGELGLPIVCLAAFKLRPTQRQQFIAKNMSNGKDFYVELRKQVTAIQQGSERAGTYISVHSHLVYRVAGHLWAVEGFPQLPHRPNVCSRRDADSNFSIGG